jgi:nucleoside-diphosphate kinase
MSDETPKNVQQCLVLIKPDGLVKSLTGDIISKLSHPTLKIMGAKVVRVSRELAEEHYQHLKEAKFFDELIRYILGEYHTKRVMALVYEGEGAITRIRDIAGKTNPEEADPESIRGKYGRITTKGVFENVIHASESEKEAEREIKLWFRPNELVHTVYPIEEKEVTRVEWFWKNDGMTNATDSKKEKSKPNKKKEGK